MGTKIYAELYHKSTGYNKEKNDFSGPVTSIPMCGSDSQVYLDARKSLSNQIADVRAHIAKLQAAEPNRYNDITGFQIMRRVSFPAKDRKIGSYQKLLDFPLAPED